MSILSTSEIKELMEYRDENCITIFMPTHAAGSEIRQDPIRFKNVLSLAEEKLVEAGWRDTDAQRLLEQAHQLDQGEFWRHQDEGLALFISPNEFRYYRVPLNFDEEVIISNRFHIKPLMPLLMNDGRFYVLALSQNQVRLFQASHYNIDEVSLEGIPLSLSEALKYDETEQQLQLHSGSPALPQGKSQTYHGQGVGVDDNKDQIRRFLQKVDRGLHDILEDQQAPMILAGVDYVISIYRDITIYPLVLSEGIPGNPDNANPKELHKQAWEIVLPYFQESQEKAATKYQELMANNPEKASRDLKEIITAAYDKRIESLFVAIDEEQWGKFNPETHEITLQREDQPENEDLLDFATIHTFLNGGAVYTDVPENLPDRALIAATFRY
ncbi:hypothetical protein VB834_19745 [Limnoraphis robusta Tam1]|uniref:Uncharacterized protein n=1 Tax=Limnoraphis robusta CCNP1315 TaxID=3110306 RepID=A0ABU5TSH2_9CYAN|nr:hypothetical protein [Limnoraphis robusta]MEA5517518.1 hypothetical protein [Limnoraphis robusta CCNP1315]MEA5541263.1 hypothetical protein [Limnoraphis robusta Tam1]MEA5544680.1 hypothetical protein [Limnoraphis robusta CCNP1324]